MQNTEKGTGNTDFLKIHKYIFVSFSGHISRDFIQDQYLNERERERFLGPQYDIINIILGSNIYGVRCFGYIFIERKWIQK